MGIKKKRPENTKLKQDAETQATNILSIRTDQSYTTISKHSIKYLL